MKFKDRCFVSNEKLLEYPSRGQRGIYHATHNENDSLYLCGCGKEFRIGKESKFPSSWAFRFKLNINAKRRGNM